MQWNAGPLCVLISHSLSSFQKPNMHNIFPRTRIHIHNLSNLWSHYFCLCLAISAFALAALVLPGNYPDYLDLIHSLSVGPYLIGLAKIGIAFPVSYHTYNGIRHLVRLNNLIYKRSKCLSFLPYKAIFNILWLPCLVSCFKLFRGNRFLCSFTFFIFVMYADFTDFLEHILHLPRFISQWCFLC